MRCLDCKEKISIGILPSFGLMPVECGNCGEKMKIPILTQITMLIGFVFLNLFSLDAWNNGGIGEDYRSVLFTIFCVNALVFFLLLIFRPLDYYRESERYFGLLLGASIIVVLVYYFL